MDNVQSFDEVVQIKDNQRIAKALDSAADKHLEQHFRKVLIKRTQREGLAKVVSEFYLPLHPRYAHIQKYIDEYDENVEKETWGKLTAQKTFGLFVTLSPEPGQFTIEDIYEATHTFATKPRKGIEGVIWVYEQSGTLANNNIGHHPHMHMLIILDKTHQGGERGKMRATVTRAFSKFKTKTDVYLDIQPVSEKGLSKKVDYLRGLKTDKTKLPMVEADKIWRKSNNLDPMYRYPLADV